MSHPFHIVDVFAEKRYAGNQLAVVRDAGDLSDAGMQQIAAEMNYSETTFVESAEPTRDGYPVRIFTPETELPFAGHPTLGTASVLREAVLDDDTEAIPLSLGVGTVPVTVESGSEDGDRGGTDEELFRMTQPEPSFGEHVEPAVAASVVGLGEHALDSGFAPQVVSTGLPTLIVPLESLAALRRARIDDTAYGDLLDATDAEAVLAFCPETVHPENDLHVRVFVPIHGVPEDPATGSSNGCLAAFLARERFFDSPAVDVRVEQGYELDRPSLLYLEASDRAENPGTDSGPAGSDDGNANGGDDNEGDWRGQKSGLDVRVGGRVVAVAEGRLL